MSNFIKKSFLISMVVMTSLWGVMGVVTVSDAAVATAGDLIKTAGSPAVYYLGADGSKYTFHHAREYFTWYTDFSGVVTVPSDEMQGYPLGTTVVVRPGTKLVQFVEVLGDGTWSTANTPEVYALSTNGSLHKIDNATTAASKFGTDWETKIIPLPNYLRANYTIGDEFTSSSTYPSGSLVKTADNDQVYYVDGSTKRPVTGDGFTGNRFNFDYVWTVADLTGYTDGTSVTAMEGDLANPVGGNVATGTGLTAVLASNNPGQQVVPLKATNVPLMRFNLTASSDGAVTVNSVVVNRTGPGNPVDFEYVYLYDGSNRLTNGKTINSTTHKATFVNMNYQIPAGTTKTLTLVGDMDTSSAGTGDVHIFTINTADISTSAAVSGSFPLTGNPVTVGSVTAGSATIINYGTLTNPYVGDTNVEIGQFNITVTNEDLTLNRISLYQGGTVSNSNLLNFQLYQDTTLLASVANVNSKNLIVFELATPYVISKNQNKTFSVKADIGGSARNAETVRTYLEQTADLYAIGGTFGYGAYVDNSGFDNGTSQYSEVTLQGGQLTVSKTGSAATYAAGDDGKSWLDFNVAAGVNLEIKNWRVEIRTSSTTLDLTPTHAYIYSDPTCYLTNVRIAATDGSFTTDSVDACSFTDDTGAGDGVYYTFTDTLEMAAGTSKTFQVLVDTGTSLDTTYSYYAVLGSTETTLYTFSATSIKNTDNNQYITDLVPSSYTQGYNMTYASSSLTTSLGNYTGEKTYVKGTNDAELLYYNFTAGTGGSVKLNSIKYSAYIDEAGGDSSMTLEVDGSTYAKDVVNNMKIYVKEGSTYTQIGTVAGIDSDGYLTFSNLNYTIPAGLTKTIVLKGNISQSASTEKLAFDIKNTSGGTTYVSATDSSGNAISTVTAQRNGCAGSITTVTYTDATVRAQLAASGSLYVSDNGSPAGGLMVAGTADNPVLKIKFNAVNSGFRISQLRISNTHATNSRTVDYVKITYKNNAGDTKFATQSFVSGNADFNLGTVVADQIYVGANSTSNVDVSVNLNSIGGTNPGAYSGDGLQFYFDENGSFEATPTGGGNTISETSSTADITGNTYVVYKSYPMFNVVQTGGSSWTSGSPVVILKFTVTATGNSAVELKKINLKTILSTTAATDYGVSLGTLRILENGVTLTAGDGGSSGTDHYRVYDGETATSASLDRTDYITSNTSGAQNMIVVFNDSRYIEAGATKTYEVKATPTFFDTTSVTHGIQTYIADGLTSTATTYKYISACGGVDQALGGYSKYCLSNSGDTATTTAGTLWSDTSGTNGDGNHNDINVTAGSVNTSADWFNSYELDNLGDSYSQSLNVTYGA